MKFQKDHYEVADHLMRTPVPTARRIKNLKKAILRAFKKNDSPDLPYEFLNTMMELSYSGHFNLALSLADETWPAKKSGLEEFKKSFSKALHESRYWRKL